VDRTQVPKLKKRLLLSIVFHRSSSAIVCYDVIF